MAKKDDDDDGKKDSFVVYKEWGMLISSLSDIDRLQFFDLLMGWDYISIPIVDSRHLQSIVSFVFGKVAENREKYLDKCKTNSAAAKARWDEYKRLKALAMQTDANAYERTQTHVNAMPNENEHDNANEHVNENEHDNDIPSKEGVGAGSVSNFTIEKVIKEWAETFGTIGNRYKTEPAYLESWRLLQNEGKTAAEAHQILKDAAAKDRTFCMVTQRRRKDPHAWLQGRDWSRDYDNEMKLFKDQESQKTTAKGGLQNNGKPESLATKAARHTRTHDI